MAHHTWQRPLLLAILALFGLALVGGTVVLSVQWIHKPFPGFFVHDNLTVGPFFLPHWSGSVDGIKSLDLVIAVDGRPLRQRSELYELVRHAPPGTIFRYRLLRNSQISELAVPSMRFLLHDWFLSFGVYLVMGVAFFVIGIAPYFFRAVSPAALPLCLMVLAAFVWFETTFDFMTTGILPKELRLFGVALTPSAGIHLALVLKTGQALWRSHPVYLGAIYGTSLFLGWLNSLLFFGPTEYWIHAFQAVYFYACAGALGFLAIIWSALRQTSANLERLRLRVIFVGGMLGFLLPTLGAVLTNSFHWPVPYNLAVVPTIFFPLSVAYALLKYSLFELGNTLKVVLSRVALAALLLALYAVVVLLLRPWFGSYENDPLVPLLFSVLVVSIFNPLLSWIEKIVDRCIYRQDYDPRRVEKAVSLYLRSLADAGALANGFLQRVTEWIGIETALLVYRASHEYLTAAADGTGQPIHHIAGKVESLLEGHMYAHGLSRDEVTNHPKLRERRAAWLKVFDELNAELVMPLIFEQKFHGFVAFGGKRSRKEYSAEDLRLLSTLTDQLALSLENGRLYQESIEARRQAEATSERLIETDRIKKQFVANICHELRTPVSTIIGYAEILLSTDLSGKPRENLQRLVQNAQALAELMDNLLNFSRMESGAVSAHYEVVKLKEILSALEIMTQRLIRERPIEFGVKSEAVIDAIETDGQKLQQILMQLLTNALKFTEKGKIELTIRALNDHGQDLVEIAVADTGIGIKKEHQEVIFEDFRQLDGSSSRQYSGTGLGLGLCKKLAQALGGTLCVASEFGMGSVFSLRLPMKAASISGDSLGQPMVAGTSANCSGRTP
jgi:signal transduction histidine kinase